MKLLLLALYTGLSVYSYSQNWPNENSTWVYDLQSPGLISGQYELQVGNDTLVDGYSGKNILMNRVSTIPSGPGQTTTIHTGFQPFGTVFNYGDSLLYLDTSFDNDTVVRLLFDYGASSGDSWLLKVDNNSLCPVDSTYLFVTSSGLLNVSGQNRRYIDIESTINSPFILQGRAIEGVGLTNSQGFGFFPGEQGVVGCTPPYDGDETAFSCYYDTENGGYPELGSQCSFVSTSEFNEQYLSIYPNPSSSEIFIETQASPLLLRVQLFDRCGRLIVSEPVNGRLDISTLDKGLYLLQILSEDKVFHTERLIVE